MKKPKTPALIARDALKLLAERNLLPTPANYQACYNQIAELPNVAGFPEASLREIAHALVTHNPAHEQALAMLDVGIARRDWKAVREALVACVGSGTGAADHAAERGMREVAAPGTSSMEFRQELACLMETLFQTPSRDDSRLAEQAGAFLIALRSPVAELSDVHGLIAGLHHRARLAAEEQEEIRLSLLKLLHLILENVGELSLDDQWLSGQISVLLDAVQPPLSLRHLDDVERRVRDVMYKQSEAKSRSVEAREDMRRMLAEFIERLASMSESSSAFEGQLQKSSHKLGKVKRIEDLAPLLKDVIAATQQMAEDTASSRGQLQSLRDKVQATEIELIKLHRELDNASAQARHDPLTDALNRKGLDEALEREIASMRRKDMPLSLSLLDLDNFKKLNDRLGHETGDAALVHLTKIARECVRPADTLARYGGEEFVILMPDTTVDQGIQTMTRLQRELTRNFFLSGEEKVLITFSAGVAQLGPTETGAEAIRRADEAMYLAKRTGKNRVLGG